MSLKRTESTISLKDSQNNSTGSFTLPIWDSSDPYRNPPPMPLHPDSPVLSNAHTNSASLRSTSPIRSLHSRNLSSLAQGGGADERITELLEIAKHIKVQTQKVDDSVNDALVEFGGLAHRSRDNGVALGHLKGYVKKTEQVAVATETAVKDNLLQVQSSLDTQRESQKALTTVTDALLESTRDINRQLQRHDGHFRDILSNSSGSRSASTGISDEAAAQHIIQEIAGHLEHSNNTLKSALYSIKDNIPDNTKLLDSFGERLDRNAADQSKSIDKLSDDLAGLSSKLMERGSEPPKEYSSILSSIQESSSLLESLTQRIDNHASAQSKSVKDLSGELALLASKFNTKDGDNKLDSLTDLVRSLSSKLDLNANEQQERSIKSSAENSVPGEKLLQEISALAQKVDTMNPSTSLESELKELSKRVELLSDNGDHQDQLTEKIVSRVSSIQDNSKEAVEQKLSALVEKLDSLDITASVKDELARLVAKIDDSSNADKGTDINGEIKEQLAGLIKSIKTIENSDNGVKEQLTDVVSKFDGMQSTTGAVQEKLKEVASKIDGLESLDSVKTQLQNVDKKVDKLDYTQSHDEIKQHLKHIIEGLAPFGVVSERLDKLSTEIKQVSSLSSSNGTRDLEKTRENNDENAGKVIEKLDDFDKTSNEKLKVFFGTVNDQLASHSKDATKTLTDIQADIRSLIDYQYGDMSSFGEQVQCIISKLDALNSSSDLSKKAEERAAASEARAAELEKQLRLAQDQIQKQQSSSAESTRQLQKADEDDSDKSAKKQLLDDEIAALEKQKSQLREDIGGMKAELAIRLEEFTKLEDRAAKYEERLSQAILDRSKGILGSTTMTIINNTPNGIKSGGSPERKPLKASSGSKRNLSFAPDEIIEDLDDSFPVGKENELSVAKRGSPFTKKNRSISLFVDH